MDVNISQLIAALPDDGGPSSTQTLTQERVHEIFADLAYRPMPLGSLHRLWTASELSAQIALAYLAYGIRQWFCDAETAEKALLETNLRVALKVFHRLGYLRGAFAKIGQTAAHMPNVLPDQVAETLDTLHSSAPPMHYLLIREVVRNEFGKDPEELFATFEREAFAAASIGQVHRATLKTGERVAVKIQYPGIARTIDADFRNIQALMLPMRLGKEWESVKAQAGEIHRMLKQEVDYRQEAESLRNAAALFQPEDGIVVPRVYPEVSGLRVLTTELLQGTHLPEYLAANPTQASRNEFGTKIDRAWWRLYLAFIGYSDPNPGNYIFLSDGRLGLLDFGCVRHFTEEERELVRLADKAAFEDPSLMPQLVQKACGIHPADPEFGAYLRIMQDTCDWMLAPHSQPGPFDFGNPSHFDKGAELFSGVVRSRHVRAHPMYVYHNRAVYGLLALLYRLGAQVDVAEVLRQERARNPA